MKILICSTLLLLAASCATHNPHIGQAWQVKYGENDPTFSYRVQHQEKDPFKKLETASEFFTFFSDDTLIIGKQGTSVQIYRSCLTYEDGGAVTGPVRIELREVFSKSDLILNNKPTVSDRKLLVSAGALYLNANAGGKNLIITCPEGVAVSVLRQSTYPGMQVFNGLLNEKGDINWIAEETAVSENSDTIIYYEEEDYYFTEEEQTIIQAMGEEDFYEGDTYFNFSASRFGWINCDAFYEDNRPKSNLIVKISNPLPEDFKSRMFLVFKNMNSVLQVYPTAPDQFESPEIPEGEEVLLVCISANEKAIFSEIKPLTIKARQMETIDLRETSEGVLKEKINGIN